MGYAVSRAAAELVARWKGYNDNSNYSKVVYSFNYSYKLTIDKKESNV